MKHLLLWCLLIATPSFAVEKIYLKPGECILVSRMKICAEAEPKRDYCEELRNQRDYCPPPVIINQPPVERPPAKDYYYCERATGEWQLWKMVMREEESTRLLVRSFSRFDEDRCLKEINNLQK